MNQTPSGPNISTIPPPTPPRKASGAKKWIIGCGSGCLVLVLVLIGLIVFGAHFFSAKVEKMSSEFEDLGYEKVSGQMLEITESPTEPTLYLGQSVKLLDDVDTDVAIVAQAAEIHATVNGTVHFRGQMLTIQPKAVLKKDLDLKAQIVQIYGTVEGEITGQYQVIDKTE